MIFYAEGVLVKGFVKNPCCLIGYGCDRLPLAPVIR